MKVRLKNDNAHGYLVHEYKTLDGVVLGSATVKEIGTDILDIKHILVTYRRLGIGSEIVKSLKKLYPNRTLIGVTHPTNFKFWKSVNATFYPDIENMSIDSLLDGEHEFFDFEIPLLNTLKKAKTA